MKNFYIGRQAIFDRNKNISSYELLFRSADNKFIEDGNKMTAQVIVSALMDINPKLLAGNKLVNINVSESFLLSGMAELLPPNKVGIEVLESVSVTDEVIAACKALKAKGYTLLLDDVIYAPHLDPLLELADVIKVDLPFIKDLEADVKILRRFNAPLLAEKVETHAEYEQAYNLGFDYFQGYYFCKPDVLSGKTVNESKIGILRALQKVMTATMVSEVKDIIKQDVNLSYRLLKYINSASFGLPSEVGSIERALVLLGLNKTQRLISVLSLASLGEGKPSELIRTALCRGYLLESLANFIKIDDAGDAFLLGMFSVIDALLDKPMAEALSDIALPDSIRKELVMGDSHILQLIDALERTELGKIETLRKHYSGLGLSDLMSLYTGAVIWSDEQMTAI